MSKMFSDLPDGFIGPPAERDDSWPDNPDLRRGVDWLKSFMTESDWKRRREAAADRLYAAALQKNDDPKGRFFAETDTLGWYLFLADAFLDHVRNYEPIFGSRVVPIIISIGRNLDLLKSTEGVAARASRLVNDERRQPNGGLFEMLVAAAYRRAGGNVAFRPEHRGKARTYDMDVAIGGRSFAVECKRMETGEYGERERMRMRELWGPTSAGLEELGRSAFCDAHFIVPIDDVPATYLTDKTHNWLASELPSLCWRDRFGFGVIGEPDLKPLQTVLMTDNVLAASNRILDLITGEYVRHANYIQTMRCKYADNPRYVKECNQVILLRWESAAPVAINAKARDITKRLSDANDQLPTDRPGIVHIGFEAVEGDVVEEARYRKILASTRCFNPGDRPLEYIYCHYFVPESPPDQAWAYDETTQCCAIRPDGQPPPLNGVFLVIPESSEARHGTHWHTA
jgi:hypothetical protein